MFKIMCRDLETKEVGPFSLEEAAAALEAAREWNDQYLECSYIWAESEEMTLS